MKVQVLQGAKLDYQDVRAYVVAMFGENVWSKTRTDIANVLQDIEQNPLSGVVVPEIEELGQGNFRQRLSGQTRIIYQIRGDVIYIHLFINTKRDLATVLYKRLMRK